MRTIERLLPAIAVAAILTGCAPEDSLFPLFVKDDQVFEQQLLGEWKLQGGADAKPEDESTPIVFRKGEDGSSYDVTISNFDGKGLNVASTARLVRLGDFLFIDFGTPDTDKRRFVEIPFPAHSIHFFGRIHFEESKIRIDCLNDEWVSAQAKAGKLTLATVQTPDGTTLSETTEELRKFALEHAEDKDAFSETYVLTRKK